MSFSSISKTLQKKSGLKILIKSSEPLRSCSPLQEDKSYPESMTTKGHQIQHRLVSDSAPNLKRWQGERDDNGRRQREERETGTEADGDRKGTKNREREREGKVGEKGTVKKR